MTTEKVIAPITNNDDLTLVSLFSGAGGLDMGFEQAGFKTIWANDILRDACETHRRWSDAVVVCDDIKNINVVNIPKSNVIAGGFPCQGFSLAGPRKIDDSRNILYKFFVRAVDANKPEVFIAENVKGIMTLGEGKIIDAIIGEFADKGYTVTATLVNAADYCVPQDRMRVIIVGVRNDLNRSFTFPKKIDNKIILSDVLDPEEEFDWKDVCCAPYSSRYMSRNRKRGFNSTSFTIPAMAKQCPLHPSSPDMVKINKDLWQFADKGITRRMSWREAALVQTFPKDLEIFGDITSKYLQIGNAVPVSLAFYVAKAIKSQVLEG